MKKLHLISNAHIDPVWQWEWEEGVGATITTFGAAADFCEEFGNYIFNHNEAQLYQWIEEFDPELFERIRLLVKAGKWHIIGGWYLQPDCNMPSGESMVRQILKGREYFRKKFGVEPRVTTNFDSFGHSKGMVQIMRNAGYTGYICVRPPQENDVRDWVWKGFNGSEILVHKALDGYNTLLGKAAEKLDAYLTKFRHSETGMFLWGVGNHGGGPSRRDYADITKLQSKYADVEFIHSTPEAFFEDMEQVRESLPVIDTDLNYTLEGCYTSQIRIKQKHMELENELYSAEKMAAHASLNGMQYPAESLASIQRDLMFAQFHDILPGTCIKSAEDASLRLLSHGLEEAGRIKLKSFFTLAGGQTKAAEGEFPILVYNPHPYTVTETLASEFMLADQNWSETEYNAPTLYLNGKEVPCQLEKEESSIPLDWRKRVVFRAELAPFSMNRFSCYMKLRSVADKSKVCQDAEMYSFDNGTCRVQINARTGLMQSYCVNGTEYLNGQAFDVHVIKNCCDPWGFAFNSYREQIGSFRLMTPVEAAAFSGVDVPELKPVRIIEDGDVRTVVEALLCYHNSTLAMKYVIPKQGSAVEVRLTLYNNERDVVIKAAIPTALQGGEYLGKTCFGVNVLPQDGREAVAQDYTMLCDREHALSVINFGNYGSSLADGVLGVTLLQSSAYSAHPIEDRVIMRNDRFAERIDQGERSFTFLLNASEVSERKKKIEFESLTAHQRPYVLSFFPTGRGTIPRPFVKLSNPNIVFNALKAAEDGNGYIVRLYNGCCGEERTQLIMEPFEVEKEILLQPCEFRSFRVTKGKITECDILEKTGGGER